MMRSLELDIIRCIAITLLLLAHVGQTIGSPIGAFFGIYGFYYVTLGGIAVTLFLILSGTVLELQYSGRCITFSQFIFKRVLRIYPVYYFSLLIGIIIFCIRSYSDTGSLFIGFLNLSKSDFILAITGMYAFVGRWGGPFVATSWFIALIMTMYLLFPFLSNVIKKYPIASISSLFFLSFLSRLILGKHGFLPMRPLDWFPLCRIFEFSFGIYIAQFFTLKTLNRLYFLNHFTLFISFISEISFPLFLVHHPILIIINWLKTHGVNKFLAIVVFLSVSLIISWIISLIDKKIPREALLMRLDNIYKSII